MPNSSDSRIKYWNRTSLISFLLAIMIIYRHNSSFANYQGMGNLTDTIFQIYHAIKSSLTEIAVPGFFMMSGFNFYNGYTMKEYRDKLIHRVKSLVVPYFGWNMIYCIFALITSETFISEFFIGREKYAFSAWNVLSGCLYHYNCNGHFWFVFDLILFTAISPLIYLLLKRKWAGSAVLVGCWIGIFVFQLSLSEVLVYRTDSILYYMLGAYFGLHFNGFASDDCNNKFLIYLNGHVKISVVCGICLILLPSLLLIPSISSTMVFFIICFGIVGLWLISAVTAENKPRWLPSGGTVFLMYASHGIIQPIVVKLLYAILPKQEWVSIINFLSSIIITLFICVFLKKIISHYMNPIDKVLCGWRK